MRTRLVSYMINKKKAVCSFLKSHLYLQLEQAFKAYIGQSGDGTDKLKQKQLHESSFQEWKSSLPSRLKKALFERRKRYSDNSDGDSIDEDFDKPEKFAWIGDKMRFGGNC